MLKKLSAKFVNQQKSALNKEKQKIQVQILELKQNDPFSDSEHALDNAAIDTDVREQVGHDNIEAQIKDLEKRLLTIEIALNKIAKNRYGFCEKCNLPIPIARLEIVPDAILCMECENK